MLERCGGAFEPTAFRLDDVNDRLRQTSSSDRQYGLQLTLT